MTSIPDSSLTPPPSATPPLKIEPRDNTAAALKSVEAERRAVGALLANPAGLIAHRHLLPAEDEFTDTACRAAFRGLAALVEKQSAFDYRAVALHIFHHDKRARVSLLKGYENPSETEALQVIEHAFAGLLGKGAMDQDALPVNLMMVRDMATRRRLSDTLRSLDKMVTDPEVPLTEITAEVTGTAIALTERSPELQMGTAAEGMAALNAHLDELDAGTKQDVCVSTGISLLDQAIDGGMIPGLHVYAAFTGNGKTTMAYHTALTVCRQGGVVVFASTEHDKARVYQEMLAIVAGVPAAAVRSGTFRRADPIGFSRASATLAAMKLYVFHFEGHQGMPFEVLETAIHVTSLKYGRVDLVVVDWMQDMQVPTSIANVKEPEKLVQTKLTYIVPRLKDLAINTGVPMIGTAQLTKESLTGGLELSYIAGSAEIARRAETALLFGRAQTHDRSRPDKNTFLIKVGKKRAQGDYPYFDNHFRLDPVSRQITTMLGEPVHPAQFRPTVSAADDMPADLYPSTNADDESMVDF